MFNTTGAPRKHLYRPSKFFDGSRNPNWPSQQEHPSLLESAPDPIAEEPSQINPRRNRRRRKRKSPLYADPHIRTAMYVAMAHAGLALSLAVLCGGAKLLQNYWRPILWAILCSIPLRELHTALVSFWSHSLHLGLLHALLAIPFSALDVTCSSLIDSHAALLRLLRYPSPMFRSKFGFSKLMEWLISFGLFIFVYERIGSFSVPAFLIPCSIAYASGFGKVKMRKLTSISSIKFRGDHSSFGFKISSCLTSIMLTRLKTMVGIGLIMFMIVGSVLGLVFFSYKIALEGKDAVISLKVHLHENDYADRIGVKKWMDENHIPELIDSYATKVSETLLQNIDSLAAYYNVTEIVHGVRNYLISQSQGSVKSSYVPVQASVRPVSQKLSYIQSRLRNGQWKKIYSDIDGLFRELASLIAREGLMGELKAFLLESLDVSKRLLTCGANILLYMAVSIVSGAAGLVNFISELMVFLWLLYYLMTSESGGVMDHVLDMVPISKSTRVRCAQVLDHAVSSVLLATAKLTLFQGCLTYLLFRFYHIHFLYTSTSLSLMSAILPITPAPLLATIPAGAQLAMEKRYIEAILLTIIHQILLEFGTKAIQVEIPGHNAYLTGLSILGGVAVFPSALEGAIMGPLLMTLMIALKRLYEEFVLAPRELHADI